MKGVWMAGERRNKRLRWRMLASTPTILLIVVLLSTCSVGRGKVLVSARFTIDDGDLLRFASSMVFTVCHFGSSRIGTWRHQVCLLSKSVSSAILLVEASAFTAGLSAEAANLSPPPPAQTNSTAGNCGFLKANSSTIPTPVYRSLLSSFSTLFFSYTDSGSEPSEENAQRLFVPTPPSEDCLSAGTCLSPSRDTRLLQVVPPSFMDYIPGQGSIFFPPPSVEFIQNNMAPFPPDLAARPAQFTGEHGLTGFVTERSPGGAKFNPFDDDEAKR